MKKEKFLYELVENYSYIACLGCMLKENYYLSDGKDEYVEIIEMMDFLLDYFDRIQKNINNNKYEADFEDAMLNRLIMEISNVTMVNVLNYLDRITEDAIGKENKDDFMDSKLSSKDRFGRKKITGDILVDYINSLRKLEESRLMGGESK